ncbi:MAG: sugar ABC transporter permease, partial [Pseudomonadota bacterium]
MPHGTFVRFIWPSFLAMILFIALPVVSVAVQSLYVEHEQVLKEVENCGPFRCTTVMQVDTEATALLNEEAPLGRFNGLQTYTNRGHLAFGEIGTLWRETTSWGAFAAGVYNLPFYKALLFTLSYTAIVTPLVILFGLLIALGVNRLPKIVKGPTIFAS